MPRRTFLRLRWSHVGGVFAVDDHRIPPVAAVHHLVFAAEVETTVVGHLLVVAHPGGTRNRVFAVKPGQLHRSATIGGGKFVVDDAGGRMRILLRTGHRAIGLFDPDLGRESEFQSPHRVIDDVRAHVAESAGAIVDETAPLEGSDLTAVGFVGGGAEPEIPVQRVRHRLACGTDEILRPDRPVRAAVDLAHFANRARLDRFVRQS